jgi:ADP-ribose 1''-phosphate phosphatase
MNRIQYIKGDLFSDTTSALLHACNCRQNWGRGVALEFAKRFPLSYIAHKQFKTAQPGDIQVIQQEAQTIICLFTSEDYGRKVSSPISILYHTGLSLARLGRTYKGVKLDIASPKINAGLFNVKWELTEELIEELLASNPNITWKVYER